MLVSIFFFFKQKTAYEMRISDWSSDVCSSDLSVIGIGGIARHADTRERGDVDDAARSGRQHRRQRIFHPEHATGQALAERIVPGLHVHGLQSDRKSVV